MLIKSSQQVLRWQTVVNDGRTQENERRREGRGWQIQTRREKAVERQDKSYSSCSPTVIILSKITDRSFRYTSPCLWNHLHRQPHSGTGSSISDSPILSPITSVSPLCTSITPSLFHSRLKTYLFHKSYLRSFTSSPYCLHGLLPGQFLLSYSVFVRPYYFFTFSLFFCFWAVR